MAGYPGSENERKFPKAQLDSLVTAIFERCGMSPADAALLSDTLVTADLRGCHSHGVLRVPEYVKKLTGGGVDPKGRPRVVSERAAALVVDGGNSMGQIGATFAMRNVIEKAADTGVAFAAVRGSNHCGAMAYYAMLALERDMIGLSATNALPTMAPWGGTGKILGINPLAVAIPAADETPIVLDAAFSGSSHGKIRVYHQKGLAIPDGWAFNTRGEPTNDAAAAIEGLLQPIGGYKGAGLAMVFGILSAVLSEASYGTVLGNMVEGARPGHDGHFMMALNIEAFTSVGRFKAEIDRIIRQIHGSALAPGCDRIYSPGELEAENAARYSIEGIPLNAATVTALAEAARSLGVEAAILQ